MLRVVDVEPTTASVPAVASSVSSTLTTTPSASSSWTSVASGTSLGQPRSTVASVSSPTIEDGRRMSCKCKTAVCDSLKESTSLNLGKKM